MELETLSASVYMPIVGSIIEYGLTTCPYSKINNGIWINNFGPIHRNRQTRTHPETIGDVYNGIIYKLKRSRMCYKNAAKTRYTPRETVRYIYMYMYKVVKRLMPAINTNVSLKTRPKRTIKAKVFEHFISDNPVDKNVSKIQKVSITKSPH